MGTRTLLPRDPAAVVAANVRRAMTEQGVHGPTMQAALGMSQAAWSRRYTGATAFTVDELWIVADALDLPVASLYGLPHLDSNQEPADYRHLRLAA